MPLSLIIVFDVTSDISLATPALFLTICSEYLFPSFQFQPKCLFRYKGSLFRDCPWILLCFLCILPIDVLFLGEFIPLIFKVLTDKEGIEFTILLFVFMTVEFLHLIFSITIFFSVSLIFFVWTCFDSLIMSFVCILSIVSLSLLWAYI